MALIVFYFLLKSKFHKIMKVPSFYQEKGNLPVDDERSRTKWGLT